MSKEKIIDKLKLIGKGIFWLALLIVGFLILSVLWENYQTKRRFNRFDIPNQTRSYEEYGDKDCSDFSSQQEAQRFFIAQGGPDNDYHNLDKDGDGIACESL